MRGIQAVADARGGGSERGAALAGGSFAAVGAVGIQRPSFR